MYAYVYITLYKYMYICGRPAGWAGGRRAPYLIPSLITTFFCIIYIYTQILNITYCVSNIRNAISHLAHIIQ